MNDTGEPKIIDRSQFRVVDPPRKPITKLSEVEQRSFKRQ